MVLEDLLDNLRRLHFLKNAAIRLPCQEPQPRPHAGMVLLVATARAGMREARDETIEKAVAIRSFDSDGDVLAQDVRVLDVAARAQKIDFEFTDAAQFL